MVFHYKGDKNKEVKAGGMLLYRWKNRDKALLEYLLICSDNNTNHEDLGGRVDSDDKNILDTVLREVAEESNYELPYDKMKPYAKSGTQLYSRNSKYVLYMVCADDFDWVNDLDFGDMELHDQIPRTIRWIDNHEFTTLIRAKKVNWRLLFRGFYDFIRQLKSQACS